MKRFLLLLPLLFTGLLYACAPTPEASSPAATVVLTEEAGGETVVKIVTATPPVEAPAAQGSAGAPAASAAPPTLQAEAHAVEVEWPGRMYLGDSDVVRLSLAPSQDGYQVTAEFPEHRILTQDVPVVRQDGYALYAGARLEGVGFEIAPAGEQISLLPENQTITWHWSLTPRRPGRQRLSIHLQMHWEPLPGTPGERREAAAYSRGLDVQVDSFFGLTRQQAWLVALLALGGSAIGGLLYYRRREASAQAGRTFPIAAAPRKQAPNPALQIEKPPGMQLSSAESQVLRAIFHRYARLQIQQEFLSGYSGARTFLLTPIQADGRADAPTIVKAGRQEEIGREYASYEAFVRRTLPPVTARILSPPTTAPGSDLAALQYTFIGLAGQPPLSLRQALRQDPNPALIGRLFEIFGPNWWMQRRPWTFRWGQEYDRLLPPHAVLQPDSGEGLPARAENLYPGARLTLRNFETEPGGAGAHVTLVLPCEPCEDGRVPLRLRWPEPQVPRRPTGRVVALREDLLRARVAAMPRFGLPDPLADLPALLESSVTGSRSIIHGDLNLENVLLGPGNLVWLIDFAATREGHPLLDFAHLEEEMLAHLLAPQLDDPALLPDFLQQCGFRLPGAEHTARGLPQPVAALLPLFREVQRVAYACLANPLHPQEFHTALRLACLGALKYHNLNAHQKHCLYLTAAFLV